MNPPKSLLERVDSLMQRKRIFVAGAAASADRPEATAADDEDLPILTEIVAIGEVSGDSPNRAVQPQLDPLVEAFGKEFSQRLQQRFAAELPRLIEDATARLTTELRQSIERIADETLAEFVAQRRSPPPAPARPAE